jgi:hypothetical protein
MSKIALSGNASGTGTLTIAAPNTNSDRTLTLPDSAGTLATAESTLTQFNASGSAPVYAARAWVNFSGITTATIRGSGNVSSITDNGTGRYQINLTTSMPNANYIITGNCSNRSGGTMLVAINSVAGSLSTLPTVGAFIVVTCTSSTSAAFDVDYVNVAIFG